MIDVQEIRSKVQEGLDSALFHLRVYEDPFTPSGNLRKMPMYEADIKNRYLQLSRIVKGKCPDEVHKKAADQLKKWADRELKQRLLDAKANAQDKASDMTIKMHEEREAIRSILASTLHVDDRIDWKGLLERRTFPEFNSELPPPVKPVKVFWDYIFPPFWAKKIDVYESKVAAWQREIAREEEKWKSERDRFVAKQNAHNNQVLKFKESFESGDPEAIVEYAKAVFERSVYPGSFFCEYEVAFEPSSKTLEVDISLPSPDKMPSILEYKFNSRTKKLEEKHLKQKEVDQLYDESVKQCVLRTIHEIFEAFYTPHVDGVVVNGWVTYTDRATGHDKTSCIITISADRAQFEAINLARIDVSECIKGLKGQMAGPLAQIAPVKPILELNKADGRFVEHHDVLAEYNSATNLAEVPWEEFEHLVRELFSKMFSSEDCEVRVTQASRDGGVDAIAFDPDPIRGGKFIIQAKRYINVVPVAAVRDLYGAMMNERASRGILVTTSYYGRDAREFSKDKPITLINGSNLVHLLEQHGHKVRIDIQAARLSRQV